ncbi:MAG: M20/M25/M40 family metallo-hydrolase [Gammaproteobacteria bacterium]|nr:M20/M25/M40 family metallo-hydrolase [Gammaproteobacteria bacterium]
MVRFLSAIFLCLVALQGIAAQLPLPLRHEIQVSLEPGQRQLKVRDTITLPQPVDALTLDLHAGLEPVFRSAQGAVEHTRVAANRRYERYRLTLPPGSTTLQVDFGGTIHDALNSSRSEQARGFRQSSGLIDAEGVFLAGSSVWYPHVLGQPYLVYSLDVELPAGWSSVSQGTRVLREQEGQRVRERWSIDKPQEEIYLIAARFTEYSSPARLDGGDVAAQVFLRSEDPKLAGRYLDATVKYLAMYERLLGDYPYGKFALVENFWETGFGMPAFTLLGSRVIRLPFIIDSSYPHEILHNWWGNGVYVDFASGNWSEGLTAYLADHLIKEQRGQAADYRQQGLQKYRDYAANNRDFPLTEFRSRHSSATESVGYGKTLMLFHMLRRQLGDELFIEGLQRLYRDFRFRVAAFSDVQQVFEQVAGQSLAQFFEQWVERTGAPALLLDQARFDANGERGTLSLAISQVQPGDPYLLDIPIAVSLDGHDKAHEVVVRMADRRQTFSIELPARPTRVDVDPRFDLFRKLAVAETPPAFTELFGAARLLVVLPEQAPAALREAWQAFARDLAHMGPEQVEQVWDRDLDALPEDIAVAVLGTSNRFAGALQDDLRRHPVEFGGGQVRVAAQQVGTGGHAFAWVTRHAAGDGRTHPRALITADLAAALPGLGRKLPHYHKYGYLAFEGDEPQNRLKGRWPVTDSPMSHAFVENAQRAQLADLPPLVEPPSAFDAGRMLDTIRTLSDPAFEGRGIGSAGLTRAAQFIAEAFKLAGLEPGGDGGAYFQDFAAAGEDGRPTTLRNIIGVIPGRHPTLAAQNLVIGAHYDHLGLGWPDVRGQNRGKVHQGADDNASGIAVLLELARVLAAGWQPDRNVVFVAFSGEEAGRLGSKHYAAHAGSHPVARSIGMLNLDTVGRLSGRALMVLGGESATEWPHIFRGIGFVTGVSTAMVAEPLDASDQVSFHEAGVPAVQLFSGAHADYHRPTDTADRIDADGLIAVAEVSRQVIEYLASRPEPLTSQLSSAAQAAGKSAARTVSLGSIPDFTYQGPGYRLDGVVDGSPAQQAGLAGGDIILMIDDRKVSGIRDVSAILKGSRPGQQLLIEFERAGERQRRSVMLDAR